MRKKVGVESNNIFFMSISDLMTGLLFIFILLFLREYLTSNKEEYKKVLSEYKILKNDNEEQKLKLKNEKEKNKELNEKNKKLEKEKEKLKLDNEKQKGLLEVLELENESYKNQDKKIEEIYQRIENKLKEAIKDNPYVKIDTVKQELILDNSVLFDSGEWKLKEKGKETLRKVLPTFFSTFLDDKEIVSYLEQLTIEGHTDDTGPENSQINYLYNLNLSQKRAFEVVNFIYDDDILSKALDESRLKKLRVYLSSNGKSNADLIYKYKAEKKVVDRAKSRRVTIKYKLDIQKIRGVTKRG